MDGLRGHAGAHAIVLADRDSVELATFQVGYSAAGISVAAAEEPLVFIQDGGGVGHNIGPTAPRNQSLVGCTVQRGSNVVRWASSWNEIKVKKQDIIWLL